MVCACKEVVYMYRCHAMGLFMEEQCIGRVVGKFGQQ